MQDVGGGDAGTKRRRKKCGEIEIYSEEIQTLDTATIELVATKEELGDVHFRIWKPGVCIKKK